MEDSLVVAKTERRIAKEDGKARIFGREKGETNGENGTEQDHSFLCSINYNISILRIG